MVKPKQVTVQEIFAGDGAILEIGFVLNGSRTLLGAIILGFD